MNDPWADVAIRRCIRCREWRSIDDYAHARGSPGKLCRTCALYGPNRRVPRYLMRSITITSLGKADLARWREEESAAVA
jgi:hypothetical protein